MTALKAKLQRLDKSISKENMLFFKNTFFLASMQAANIFLPFLTLPYLMRVLGVENFGLVFFAIALINYFTVVVDYGFNLTATRDISVVSHRKDKVDEIFSAVFTLKIFLLFTSFIVYTAGVLSFSKTSSEWQVFIFSFGIVIGQALFPVWFFQGMQDMKTVSIINVLSRLVSTILIFCFVNEERDYILVPLFMSAGFILSAILSLLIVVNKYNVSLFWVGRNMLTKFLIDGRYVFLSQLKITLFSTTNSVIIGFLSGNAAVGIYTAAEKIMRVFALLQVPITGALYPIIAKKIKEDINSAIKKLKLIAWAGTLFYTLVALIVFIFAKDIVRFVYSEEALEAANLLKIISIVPLFIFLNNLSGTQILLNIGEDRKFFLVFLVAALISLISCYYMVGLFSYLGAGISLLGVELFIMTGMYFSSRRVWRNA